MEPLETQRRTVRLPRRDLFYLLLGAITLFELVGLVLKLMGYPVVTPMFTWPLYLIGPMMAWTARPRKLRSGAVRVDAGAVAVDGEVLARREHLGMGILRREGSDLWLRVSGAGWRRGRLLDIALENEDEAKGLLERLGLDAKSRTALFILRTQKSSAGAGALMGLVMAALVVMTTVFATTHLHSVFAAVFGVIAATTMMVGSFIALARSRAVRMTIGVDGLLVKEGFAAPRFIPHDDVATAVAEGATVHVTLHDGTSLRFLAGAESRRKVDDEQTKHAEAIAQKIVEARAAFIDLSKDTANVPALARASRSTRDWLLALQGVAESGGTYRDGSVTREKLLRVAESGHAGNVARIAAAVALAKDATDDEKARLASIAESAAAPALAQRIRVATTTTDEAELEKMIEEAEEAELGVRRA